MNEPATHQMQVGTNVIKGQLIERWLVACVEAGCNSSWSINPSTATRPAGKADIAGFLRSHGWRRRQRGWICQKHPREQDAASG